MFKVEIKNLKGDIANKAIFKTEQEMMLWIAGFTMNENLVMTYGPFNDDELFDLEKIQAKKDIDFGLDMIAEILTINRRKIKTGQWTSELFSQFMQDAAVAQIQRLLEVASFPTAIFLIQSLQVYYSDSEKNRIINKINEYMVKNG